MVETAERKTMRIAVCFFCAFLLSCGEWESATVGRVSCELRNFNGFSTPIKISIDRDNLYILDNASKVHFYKRDDLYECVFDYQTTHLFTGFPNDVFPSYVQDRTELKSFADASVCRNIRDGAWAIYGNELAVGSNMGIETWNINSCTRTGSVSSQKVLALAATSSEYYAAEDLNLARFSKSSSSYRTPIPELCSKDRVIANNYAVYILDKTCRQIGVYDHQPLWRKTISLDSLGIRGSVDIASGEYSYIYILHANGIEKVNVF